MENKYYSVKGKNRAITISYLLGEDFMVFKDKKYEGQVVYSFKKSDKLFKIINCIDLIKSNC